MATINNKRTQITKQLFHQSLIKLLESKTMNEISIKMICEEAELNRSTFYLHYDSPYDLLKEIQSDVIEKSIEYLLQVQKGTDSMLFIQKFLSYIKDNTYIFKVLLNDSNSSYFIDEYIQVTQKVALKDIKSSEKKKTEPYLNTFVMQGCFNVIKQWIQKDFDLSEKELSDFIFRLCKKCYL